MQASYHPKSSPAEADTGTCPSCHSLAYDQFESGEQWKGTGYCYPLPRYRYVTYGQIKAAMEGHCETCSVLCQGLRHFWGEEDQDDSEDRRDNETDGLTDPNTSECSTAEWPNREPLQQNSQLCITLQPGRSISVSRDSVRNVTYLHTRLEYFTEEEDIRPPIHPAFGKAGLILNNLEPQSAADLLKKWLKNCDQHERCSPDSQTVPTRLLDISSRNPRLIETGENYPPGGRYMTLSHRWGSEESKKPLTTTRDTYRLRRQGIEWPEFPQLFRDAATLARMLECHYIWIDSLCIVQDDGDDWAEQSAQMADIYSNSYLNLATASALNPHEALFQPRGQFLQYVGWTEPQGPEYGWLKPHRIQPLDTSLATILVRPYNKTGHECVLGSATSTRSLECPLLERAWVYQERLLAPRTAFFARSELMWQCRESSNCECGDVSNYSKLMSQIELKRPDRQVHPLVVPRFQVDSMCWEKYNFERILTARDHGEAQYFWLQTVGYYGWMDLTKESDRSYAIAGVAQRLQAVMEDKYLAGLWRQDLPRGLLWSPNPRCEKGAVRLGGGIPTWSWMSRAWNARLWATYRLEEGFRVDSRVSIIDEGTWCKTAGSQFGPPTSGQIELEAAAYRATAEFSTKDKDFFLHVQGNTEKILLQADCPFDPAEPLQDGDEVVLMVLGEVESGPPTQYCLVLRLVDASRGVYSRVGIANIECTSEFGQDASILRVVIV